MSWHAGHNKTIINTTIAVLLCGLFIIQLYNKSAYTHLHIKADGTIITHAHPYNKSSDTEPVKKHHHTDTQYALLAQLDMLFFMAFLLFALHFISKKQIYIKRGIQAYLTGFISQKPGRSPPVHS